MRIDPRALWVKTVVTSFLVGLLALTWGVCVPQAEAQQLSSSPYAWQTWGTSGASCGVYAANGSLTASTEYICNEPDVTSQSVLLAQSPSGEYGQLTVSARYDAFNPTQAGLPPPTITVDTWSNGVHSRRVWAFGDTDTGLVLLANSGGTAAYQLTLTAPYASAAPVLISVSAQWTQSTEATATPSPTATNTGTGTPTFTASPTVTGTPPTATPTPLPQYDCGVNIAVYDCNFHAITYPPPASNTYWTAVSGYSNICWNYGATHSTWAACGTYLAEQAVVVPQNGSLSFSVTIGTGSGGTYEIRNSSQVVLAGQSWANGTTGTLTGTTAVTGGATYYFVMGGACSGCSGVNVLVNNVTFTASGATYTPTPTPTNTVVATATPTQFLPGTPAPMIPGTYTPTNTPTITPTPNPSLTATYTPAPTTVYVNCIAQATAQANTGNPVPVTCPPLTGSGTDCTWNPLCYLGNIMGGLFMPQCVQCDMAPALGIMGTMGVTITSVLTPFYGLENSTSVCTGLGSIHVLQAIQTAIPQDTAVPYPTVVPGAVLTIKPCALSWFQPWIPKLKSFIGMVMGFGALIWLIKHLQQLWGKEDEPQEPEERHRPGVYD